MLWCLVDRQASFWPKTKPDYSTGERVRIGPPLHTAKMCLFICPDPLGRLRALRSATEVRCLAARSESEYALGHPSIPQRCVYLFAQIPWGGVCALHSATEQDGISLSNELVGVKLGDFGSQDSIELGVNPARCLQQDPCVAVPSSSPVTGLSKQARLWNPAHLTAWTTEGGSRGAKCLSPTPAAVATATAFDGVIISTVERNARRSRPMFTLVTPTASPIDATL
ncbi:unnamed protein product [Mesocestoides corti]|uniref:Uncharacterized protein n=1 Tax=Mesocestoides corti TaxID=53468 RepID=A0A0R3U3U7_MESCO|nr:unnamed protein product [Mesocestoides corti]